MWVSVNDCVFIAVTKIGDNSKKLSELLHFASCCRKKQWGM